MSRTKSTPDEPRRGSVATGQQPVETTGARDGAPGSANGGGGNDRAVKPSGPVGATSRTPEPELGASDASTVTGSDIVTAEAGGAPAGSTPAPSSEAATTQMRVPADATRSGVGTPGAERPGGDGGRVANGRGAPASSPDTVRVEPAAPGVADRVGPKLFAPSSTPTAGGAPQAPPAPSLNPVPAPAVPVPGPGAAQPPPWRRVPGQDGRADAALPTSAADRLLGDDGPTAFLETPRYAPQSPTTPGAESSVSDTGGWVRVSRSRPPRQAALQLKRLDPWSVLKLALVLAVVLFLIWLVAVGVLYGVLDGIGVWDRLNGTYADLVSGEAPSGSPLISAGRVFGIAAVVGAINSLLFAVAVTVGAFVYNVSADLVGGIEVTLSERD